MENSRTANVKKNIFWSYVSNIGMSIISMISRTLFVYILGAKYLGISGLFTNILGILSFTNLGIGSAIVFALYKPIADNDTEKIKSLMQLYKIAYRIIAVVIAVLGCLLLPFLKYLVNTDIPISEIKIYYILYLTDTVASYFVSYKTSYVTAIQKNYVITNLNTIMSIVTYVVQFTILIFVPNFLLYLINQVGMSILLKFVTVIYLNKKYPILTSKGAKRLDNGTKKGIWKNVRALIIHKIGDAAVNQTDNIIISIFVSTTTVGLISNYIALSTMISTFTNTLFNSFTASIGNLVAKENRVRRKKVFDAYDFASFWVFGFVFISFVTLVQPFMILWLGENLLVDDVTVVLFFFSLYLQGMTFTTYNFKVAAGRFDEDKWIAFIQAVVNLVVSIVFIKLIGLPGVYIGTIAQRLIVVAVRPYIVYKYVFGLKVFEYYKNFLIRLLIIGAICGVMLFLKGIIIHGEVNYFNFALMVVLTCIIPNLILFVLFGRTDEFSDLKNRFFRRQKNDC